MATANFVLRPSTRKGRYPGSLSLRVIHDRKVKTTAMGCHLYPQEWDSERQTVIYPENDPHRTSFLEEAQAKITACGETVQDIIAALEKQGRYTTGDITGKLRRKKDDGRLLGYVDVLADDLERGGQYRLSKAYRTVSNALVKFNKGVDIPLNHMNATLIKAFETELMNKGKKPNTISYYMRNLRAIYNKAVKAHRIPAKQDNPFAGVYTKVHQTTKRALTVGETTSLYAIDFNALREQHPKGTSEREHIENLHFAHRLFMFCFFAQGMCFIDMAHLRKENIKDGVCTYYRKKTRKEVEVKVNEGMQKIIDSFAAEVVNSPYLFPIITGEGETARRQYETALRTQNRRLKALAKLAEIDKRLTTHVARHTCATSVMLANKVTLENLAKILGHKSTKMTQRYARVLDSSIMRDMGNVEAAFAL